MAFKAFKIVTKGGLVAGVAGLAYQGGMATKTLVEQEQAKYEKMRAQHQALQDERKQLQSQLDELKLPAIPKEVPKPVERAKPAQTEIKKQYFKKPEPETRPDTVFFDVITPEKNAVQNFIAQLENQTK